jgi:hypothetical protein
MVKVADIAIDGYDKGRLSQAGTDVGGQVGTGGTLGQVPRGTVWKGDRELRHSGSGLLVNRLRARRRESAR